MSPTQAELTGILSHLGKGVLEGTSTNVCGFGPIAAAARTSLLIARHQPEVVLLAGIAGSLDPQCIVGDAYRFHCVRSYGVGVGDGQLFQSAEQIGWKHLQENGDDIPQSIGDVIRGSDESSELDSHSVITKELLSVCAASSSEADVKLKQKSCPEAVAEDMEGFAVAAACIMNNVRWIIVRGISNHAGDRTHSNWQIEKALKNTSKYIERILAHKQ